MAIRSRFSWLLTCLFVLPLNSTASAAENDVDYQRDVKPLFAVKCAACHGVLKQEAGLRLDHGQAIREGGESGQVVNIRSPSASSLIERITSTDSGLRMPPEGEGERLTDAQIRTLADWIAGGAQSPSDKELPIQPNEHWAWQPIDRSILDGIPESTEGNLIDQLIAAGQSGSGVVPLPPADARTQLRRLYFDLTGLPPSVQQQREFESSPTEENWTRIAEQLLASPAYGQRWARHWMDVWRYSDWDGYKNELRGSQRHIWRWRDWIEESLTNDNGYDRMIVEMIAGDEVAPGDPSVLRATGFLARNFHKSNRDIWLDATVEHTAKAFLATTINCARCHDHKYDPISQKDYYAMRAVFEPHHVRTERLPGESNLEKDGLVRAFDKTPDEKTYLYFAGNEKRPDKDNPVAAQIPHFFDQPFDVAPIELPLVAFAPDTRAFVQREETAVAEATVKKARDKAETAPSELAESQLSVAQANLASLTARWEADLVKLKELNETPNKNLTADAVAAEQAAVLAQAKHDVLVAELAIQKIEKEKPDSKQAIDAKLSKTLGDAKAKLAKLIAKNETPPAKYTPAIKEYPRQSTGRRRAFARWIASPDNPLTARVAVNHIWVRYFGRPLVANVFDFGLRSPQPAHWRVLDYLAAELVDNNWSLKHVHRLIVASCVYRRASHAPGPEIAANTKQDPDNTLLWRANVRRLDAEAVRDQLIFVAGNLDPKRGGPDIDFKEGESVYRRSLYFRHAYEKQMTMLVLFDGAAPTECYQRSESIVPQQALALANSPLSFDQSRAAAKLIWKGAEDDAEVISLAFERLLGRCCTEAESTACVEFLERQTRLHSDPSKLEVLPGKSKGLSTPAQSPAERARENLVHTLVNHNDFVTLR